MKGKLLFYLFLLALSICIVYYLKLFSPYSAIRDSFLKISYQGYVERKFHDPSQRNTSVVVINGETHYIDNTEMYNLIDSGDFIIKNRGTTKHILIKKNDTTVFYPTCFGKEVKDN